MTHKNMDRRIDCELYSLVSFSLFCLFWDCILIMFLRFLSSLSYNLPSILQICGLFSSWVVIACMYCICMYIFSPNVTCWVHVVSPCACSGGWLFGTEPPFGVLSPGTVSLIGSLFIPGVSRIGEFAPCSLCYSPLLICSMSVARFFSVAWNTHPNSSEPSAPPCAHTFSTSS